LQGSDAQVYYNIKGFITLAQNVVSIVDGENDKINNNNDNDNNNSINNNDNDENNNADDDKKTNKCQCYKTFLLVTAPPPKWACVFVLAKPY